MKRYKRNSNKLLFATLITLTYSSMPQVLSFNVGYVYATTMLILSLDAVIVSFTFADRVVSLGEFIIKIIKNIMKKERVKYVKCNYSK